MSWWRRFCSLIRWLFASPPTCNRPDCTEEHLCDDCVDFWSIK